ncbi:hypothetical protein E5163_01775 [Marinicauda algicola]|uniref:Thioredoxin domain-containing protein n=2 Tax=Marinicauda algicola TaxID=2029849 RepID=A0A4S2H521_9PROT|nr:hypothetical protein E5163_01775 [Marinicauda algicola]
MVDARLVSDREAVAPGETFHVGLHQDITPGWHTYWRNPGDSGEPTRIALDLPEGWQSGEIVWPAPKPYPLGPLTNYGYSDAVTLPIPVHVPADAPPGPVRIEAEATWLVCEEICIPEEGTFALELEVGEGRVDREGARLVEVALERAPAPAPDGLQAGLARVGADLVLSLAGARFARGDDIRDLAFFPHEGGVIDHAAPQRAAYDDAGAALFLTPGFLVGDRVDAVHGGVVTAEFRENGRWVRRAFTILPEPGVRHVEAAPSAAGALQGPPPAGGLGLAQAIVFALIGGLLLNLMPCVFPILSMKALNLVHKRGAEAARARELGLVFAGGVISTFLALGIALVAARALGLPDLWGFQLQVPAVVAALALLMFLIGLNFLGAFHIGSSLQGIGGAVDHNTRAGSFLTGVLAVFVAAPCLAPFMAGALTFAMAQPPAIALVIFACLGLGLAAPFVLVSFNPRILNLLPRPGPWMVRFKQVLAFPMFAVAIWLVWVLSVQTGASGVAWVLVAGLGAGFAVWALQAGGLSGRAAGLAGAVLAAAALAMTARLEPVAAAAPGGDFEPWSPARVAELQAEGRPVFVDFTAAWCVTCQVNKIGTLADGDVRAAFAEHRFALLRADFTNRDPVIADTLKSHGSAGVPMYLVYPDDGGPAEKLPPVLTETIVLDAIARASRQGREP